MRIEYTMNLLLTIKRRLELAGQKFDAKFEEEGKTAVLNLDICQLIVKINGSTICSSVSFLICMILVRRRGECDDVNVHTVINNI